MFTKFLDSAPVVKLGVLTALAVTFFYALGYLGHLGELHMLGVNLPVASVKDHMFGGIHQVYQLFQALVISGLYPFGALAATWREGIWHYPLLALLLPLSLWGLKRLSGRFADYPRAGYIRPALYGLFTLLLVLFAYFWTASLWRTLEYQNMLFPVSLSNQAEQQRYFDERYGNWLQSTPNADDKTRQAHKDFLRGRILAKEMKAAPVLAAKLHAWKTWKARSNLHKHAWLAALLITGLLYAFAVWLLYRYLAPDPNEEQADAAEKPQIIIAQPRKLLANIPREKILPVLRNVYAVFFSLVLLVQFALLPVAQGIKLSEPRYAVVEVADKNFPEFAGQRFLKLAEGNWLYLYSDLWRIHSIKSGKIEHLEIVGQDDVFAWLELIP